MAQQRAGEAILKPPWPPKLRRVVGLRSPVFAGAASARVAGVAILGSRALVWLGGLGTMALFGHNTGASSLLDPQHLTAPFRASWLNFVFAPTARWDSVWYLRIADSGYVFRPSAAFFPLYPLLMHLGSGVLGSPLVAGVVISVVAMALALYYLDRLVRIDLGESIARSTILFIAFFPTALFFSAVYTESLFLALSVGAVYAARLDRWWLASLLGGLAAASRPNGFLVVVPLAVLFFYGPIAGPALRTIKARAGSRSRSSRSSLWLVLVPLGLAAYLAYFWITQHAPLAPFQAEGAWGRHFAGPFGAAVKLVGLLPHDVNAVLHGGAAGLTPGDAISWPAHDLIDLGFLGFAVLGLAFSWRRLPLAYSLYALAMLAESLSYPLPSEPLASFPRYIVVVFPLFMGWAARLSERRLATRSLLVLSAVGLIVCSGLFAYWDWVA